MALNLQNLPPPAVIQLVNFDDLLDRVLANFRERQPEYIEVIEGDPAYSILEVMAFVMSFFEQRINNVAAAVLVTHATGSDLENLGALWSIAREEGESDDALRVRIVERLETIVPGSLAWYRQYAVQVVEREVDGADNVIDGVETPIDVSVKDALVVRTPNPSFDDTMTVDETNLPDIPGSIDLYVQTESWTHPTTDVLTQVIPTDDMLQAVKNYLDAEGTNESDAVKERDAQHRRFICDTVNVYAASIHPYIICVEARVIRGLDEFEVQSDLRESVEAFALENELIGQRIPLSDFYSVLNAGSVSEIQLMYPAGDIEPADSAVPVALPEVTLAVEGYRAYVDSSTFAGETGDVWSVGEESSVWYLFFKVGSTSTDYTHLGRVVEGRRFGVYAQDSNGDPELAATQTYRANDVIESVSTTHYRIPLMDSPAITGLTDDDDYTFRILDSLEIMV